MSKTIQHKRSSVAGNQPNASQIEVGELAINFPDRSIYTKDGSNIITELARDIWRTDSQPDSAQEGDLWYDTTTGDLSLYDGTDWGDLNSGGIAIDANNVTTVPAAAQGDGSQNDPFLIVPTVTNVGYTEVHIATVTITGLNAYQIEDIIDLRSADNGARFISNNAIANAQGVLTFTIVFNDVPQTINNTSYDAEIQVGRNESTALRINASATVLNKLEGSTEIEVPSDAHGSGPHNWQGTDRTLTAEGDLEISVDGFNYTQSILVSKGDQFWTRWKGTPGSGIGIDKAHGTTIVGSITDGIGGHQPMQFTIDKETIFEFQSLVDSDAILGGISHSHPEIVIGKVNSYVYPYGSTTGSDPQYLKNHDSNWISLPTTNTGSPVHYFERGDTLEVRHTNSGTINTASTLTFNMAGHTAEYTSVTADADPLIHQPEIESPAFDGALGFSRTGPLVSSDFEMSYGTDTHTASSWQVLKEGWDDLDALDTAVSGARQYSLAANGTRYVTGGHPGMATSTDGFNWTAVNPDVAGQRIDHILWDGSKFIATSSGKRFSTSTNGTSWTSYTGTVTIQIYAMAYDGSGTYVGVGGSGECATSSDGINWTANSGLSSVKSTTYNDILWSPVSQKFIAVGHEQTICLSDDGITWTKLNINHNNKNFQFIKQSTDGSVIIAGGLSNNNILYNVDGGLGSWTPAPLTAGSQLWDAHWVEDHFIVISPASTMYFTSNDGAIWNSHEYGNPSGNAIGYQGAIASIGQQIIINGDGGALVGGTSIVQRLDSDTSALTSWTLPTQLDEEENYSARVKHHTSTLNSAWSEERTFITAGPPGTSWIKQDDFTAAFGAVQANQVIWDGSQFVAVGNISCATSPDGVNWTNQPEFTGTNGMTGEANAIAWNGSIYCVVGFRGEAIVSPDLVNWTKSSGGSSLGGVNAGHDANDVIWGGGQFVATCDGGRLCTSPDGLTWTFQTGHVINNDATYYYEVNGISYDGNAYISAGYGKISRSTDAVTWTAQTYGGGELFGITYGNGMFLAYGRVSVASTDGGITWGQNNLITVMGDRIYDVVWSGTQFVAVGRGGNCATSPDGVNWTSQPGIKAASGTTPMNSVAWDGDQFCAVGYYGICVTS